MVLHRCAGYSRHTIMLAAELCCKEARWSPCLVPTMRHVRPQLMFLGLYIWVYLFIVKFCLVY